VKGKLEERYHEIWKGHGARVGTMTLATAGTVENTDYRLIMLTEDREEM
jgi:hypothetical protein